METTYAIRQPVMYLDESLYVDLYDDVFPVVASIVSRQGGSYPEAEDVFQDALIAFIDMNGRIAVDDPKKYIVGIAKHLWMRRSKKGSRFLALDEYERSLTLPDDIASEIQPSALLRFLQRAGLKCMNLLRDFYLTGQTVAELATAHGFSTAHSASVQKNKCLEKVRTIVKDKQLTHDDFME